MQLREREAMNKPPRIVHDFEVGKTFVPISIEAALADAHGVDLLKKWGRVEYVPIHEYRALEEIVGELKNGVATMTDIMCQSTSYLDEVLVPETGETRLDNITNAVALMSLVRDPPPISITARDLGAILNRLARAEKRNGQR